jgi:cytoskeletal protein CcmA (bactofilin family)
MWKKPNAPESSPTLPPETKGGLPQGSAAGSPARIGASLTLKGELHGQEDLVIEGSVQGKIALRQASVTVGEKGRVEADIEASNIRVAGEVKGNLAGSESVVLHPSGRVEGNISAKSVTLENGCRFKGSIDMESQTRPRSVSKEQGVAIASMGTGRA